MVKNKVSDKQVLDLIEVIKKKKAEIAKADRPNYKTNMSFKYSEGNQSINLNTIQDVNVLASIMGFIVEEAVKNITGRERLGLPEENFKWQGFTIDEWTEDLRARAAKVQINQEKAKLDVLEKRLDAIVSPELKAQMEFESIMAQV